MPYCPTPQHLLHMQEGVNLLSLKTFGELKRPGYLNSLRNYSQTHNSDVRWCKISSRYVIDKRKEGGGGYDTSSPISLSSIFYYQALQENYIFWTIFVIKFFKQAGECCYLLKWLFLWVIQSFMSLNIKHRNLWCTGILSVCIGQKCCMPSCIYLRFTSAGMRDTCIWTLM